MGEPVLGVLQVKHPEAHSPSAKILDSYSIFPPKIVSLNLTEDIAMEVTRCLSGGDGPGSTN